MLVLGLLRDNAGCRLPCWWGFTPGQTPRKTVWAFFSAIGRPPTQSSVNIEVPEHGLLLHQMYGARDEIIDAIYVRAITLRENETVYGDPQFLEDWRAYMLPQLLVTYGQPDQVWLKTHSSGPGEWLPYHLLLLYEEQGFMVRYYGPVERDTEAIRICPGQTDITLFLWSPGTRTTLEDIAPWGDFPKNEVPDFRLLEEATGMTVEQFYQVFVYPANQECFDTPADLWP